MKRFGFRWIWLIALTLTASAAAQAVPTRVPYVAYLSTDAGAPFVGSVDVEATLYATANPTPGVDTAVWGPASFGVQSVQDGLLHIELGGSGSDPIDSATLQAGALWLSIRLNGVLLTPAQRVLSVPYAVLASDSLSLGGIDAADYLTAPDLSALQDQIASMESDVSALSACCSPEAARRPIAPPRPMERPVPTEMCVRSTMYAHRAPA